MTSRRGHLGFFGRNEELAWLRDLFDAVATPGADGASAGPRMAVIVAESGIGKSRLVQELYIQLTSDPRWDPPEVDYWPDAFGDGGVDLRTVPRMDGHVPKGPPRFAWLGARWHAPDERNAVERTSVLPEVKASVTAHAKILQAHGPAWRDAVQRVRRAVRTDGIGESAEAAADLVGLPFFGVLRKVARGGWDLVADRRAGAKTVAAIEAEQAQGEVEEVLECMRELLSEQVPLPTVLWLDDAQWIDEASLNFLTLLWEEAVRKRWPLLVVATHWERDWREAAQAARAGAVAASVYRFAEVPGVEVRVLQHAPAEGLRDYVRERLPGLTPAQQQLLVGKAAGNFLQMAENVEELVRYTGNFVGHQTDAALSAAGERKVERWESQREKRVEQRFSDLESDVKDVLGWSSHLGQRFLRDVVIEFGTAIPQRARDIGGTLERSVDPYVILGAVGEHLREFRDGAYRAVASRHFVDYFEEQQDLLTGVLRRHLVEWVNNSFDAEGNEIWPDADQGVTAPDRSATGLNQQERRHLLEMAVRELPLPEHPDWTDPHHVAAVRAVYLLVITERWDGFWDRVLERCQPLADVAIESMPGAVISLGKMERLCDQATTAGAYRAAERVAKAVLEVRRRMLAEADTPERQRDLSVSLDRVGDIHKERSAWDAALGCYEEGLGIARALVAAEATPGRQRDLSLSLDNVGDIHKERSAWDAALGCYEESLALARWLVEGTDDPLPVWTADFNRALARCRGAALELGEFQRAHEFAVERLQRARVEVDGDDAPSVAEHLLAHACPVLHCELELGLLDEATHSAALVKAFVAALRAAFDDPTVDRAEQRLDSLTLFRCAEACDLLARFHSLTGDDAEQQQNSAAAAQFGAAAEQLQAEESATAETEGGE